MHSFLIEVLARDDMPGELLVAKPPATELGFEILLLAELLQNSAVTAAQDSHRYSRLEGEIFPNELTSS